jgi:hypothetical protein
MLAVAWKAASRIAEVLLLTKAAFKIVDDHNVVISWGQDTKGTRVNPYAEYMVVWLAGDLVPQIIQAVRAARPGRLFRWTKTSEVTRLLPRPYTGHSFKHGAAAVLLDAVADGELTEIVMMRILTWCPWQECCARRRGRVCCEWVR